MFKFIAIRILSGCDVGIRKCLRENTLYYLCNDYLIADDGEEIKFAHRHIGPLSDSFFALGDNTGGQTAVNLQAIIGMNGDGKSSLVEIALRLINNFAFCRKMSAGGNLVPANQVCAQLYYMLDGSFYCLSEENGEVQGMQLFRYEETEEQGVFRRGVNISDEALKEEFFYTLVSNYSHYAYNTSEYLHESAASDDEDCWMHNIFHKNDGYQVPLSLHPYRKKGNIDINREKELTKPRLVRTLVRGVILSEEKDKGHEMNGKEVVGLKLTEVGYSKFQNRTLKEFFVNHKHTSLLWEDIERLREMHPEHEMNSAEFLLLDYTRKLKKAYNKYFGHERNRRFYILVKKWMHENELKDSDSDISIFLKHLQEKAQHFLNRKERHELEAICDKWEEFADFNLCQIQRIELIDDICDQWASPGIVCDKDSIRLDITPEVLMKPYESLSEHERCLHYIVYKTISIFETYDSYGSPCTPYVTQPFFFRENSNPEMPRETLDDTVISSPFAKLSRDWQEGSHITLKLRQTYNFHKGHTKKLYLFTEEERSAGSKTLEFVHMTKTDREHLQHSELLPPAIYYWDIIFRADDEIIALDSFSSGEKQRLFSMSAILYHLQNISSVAEEIYHYHNVNLILEEIELYFHPEWQRTFSHDLIKWITDAHLPNIRAVNILFVTHSPYILSDIPKTNVLFIRKGRPVTSMQENTFGSNINGLLKNGFFMPSLPMGEFAYRKINTLFAKLHSGDFGEEELGQMRDDIMTVGEPAIRHQLLTLYNSYRQFNTELKGDAFRNFIMKKLADDQPKH